MENIWLVGRSVAHWEFVIRLSLPMYRETRSAFSDYRSS